MIRKAKKGDTERILDIWLQVSLKAHNFVNVDYWHNEVENMRMIYLPAAEIYVFEVDNEVVGFYALHNYKLAAIFVEVCYQGNGIGGKLIKHGFKAVQEQVDIYTA